MNYIFDRETALLACGDDNFTVPSSDVYRNPTGANFGGWVAAIMARAVELHERCSTPLVALQTTFIKGTGPGDVEISVKLLRSGASTQFWRVELWQNGAPVVVGDAVSSDRRPTDMQYQLEMPACPGPDESPDLTPASGMAPHWVQHYDQRIAKGTPFRVNDTPETLVWIREADGRPIDRISIASICDTPMPRSFFLSEELRMGSTVSMGTYIYASKDDIATAGSDWLLLRVDGATVRNSKHDSRAELWSKDGTLLATSNQIGFFR